MNARARGNWQGMNWIRQEKRLAIYLRDGCACVWCGATIEDGAQLTLDHVVPHSKGGDNSERNLVTACKRCNDSRGARGATKFAEVVAAYLDNGILAKRISQHVMTCMYRDLAPHLEEAKRLIARRGTAFAVLQMKREPLPKSWPMVQREAVSILRRARRAKSGQDHDRIANGELADLLMDHLPQLTVGSAQQLLRDLGEAK